MSNSVLILGSSDASPLAEALADRGFAAVAASEAEAPQALGGQRYQAIVLGTDTARPAPQTVAELVKSGQAAGAPIIVSVGALDAALRDQCLISGSHDVSLSGAADDVAGRVDAAVNGWLRASPRRQLKATFKAQRGRQFLDLKVTDIDPTGFGVAPIDGLALGALLRVSIALPDGELLAWGRLNSADGAPGVRFIGLVPEERQRVVSAIRGRAPEATPPRPVTPPTIETPDFFQEPATVSSAPAAPVPPPSVRIPSAPPPSAPVAVAAASVAPATPTPMVIAPSDMMASPEPEEVTPTENSIADAIGSALEEPQSAEAPAEQAGADPEMETILWPSLVPAIDVCIEMLGEAATVAAVGERENAPPTHVVLAFARTLSPIEKRAFDATPPPELPEQSLAVRCLAHRLRLFLLTDEASSVPTDGAATILIDEDSLARVMAEVNAASSELQKVIDGFVATAQTQRIKEINTFRNALTRGQSDLKAAVARLRGEVMARGNMALLDVHERVPGQATQPPIRRPEPTPAAAPEKKPEPKAEFFAVESTPQQRERRRIMGWVIVMVVLAALGTVLRFTRRPPRTLSGQELAEFQDVKDVILAPKTHHALVVVSAGWKPDQAHRASLDAMAQRYELETFMVQNAKGEAVASRTKGRTDLTLFTAAPPAK